MRERDDRDVGDAGGRPPHQLQPGGQRGKHTAPPRRTGKKGAIQSCCENCVGYLLLESDIRQTEYGSFVFSP